MNDAGVPRTLMTMLMTYGPGWHFFGEARQ
jgi:hypothetical protein